MITVIVSLIFYMADPILGVIMALVLPIAVSLDTTGEYSYAVVSVMFAAVSYFVRKIGILDGKDE